MAVARMSRGSARTGAPPSSERRCNRFVGLHIPGGLL
jgi:hypothetical protein